MPDITFIHPNGKQQKVRAPDGESLMHAASYADVNGIVAECGGSAICATCHVYVDPVWFSQLPPIQPDEEAMLECTAAERRPTSRLSCQIEVTLALNGMSVTIPDRQQ